MTAPLDCPPLPPTRPYHRGTLINQRGGVSVLCFASPRAINLKRASWTNRDEAVTCPKCLALMRLRPAARRPQDDEAHEALNQD